MLFLPLVLITSSCSLVSLDAAHIERLVEQLGAEVYAEREAATRALSRVGEAALEPLRRACACSSDAEIRRRAERLVPTSERRVGQEKALAIRRSQLSPDEKGRRLKALVKEGMTGEEVHQLLGLAGAVVSSSHSCTAFYSECRLCISYDQYGRVSSIK
jgi:hypothetical protein